jgi:hypothetical protein
MDKFAAMMALPAWLERLVSAVAMDDGRNRLAPRLC